MICPRRRRKNEDVVEEIQLLTPAMIVMAQDRRVKVHRKRSARMDIRSMDERNVRREKEQKDRIAMEEGRVERKVQDRRSHVSGKMRTHKQKENQELFRRRQFRRVNPRAIQIKRRKRSENRDRRAEAQEVARDQCRVDRDPAVEVAQVHVQGVALQPRKVAACLVPHARNPEVSQNHAVEAAVEVAKVDQKAVQHHVRAEADQGAEVVQDVREVAVDRDVLVADLDQEVQADLAKARAALLALVLVPVQEVLVARAVKAKNLIIRFKYWS